MLFDVISFQTTLVLEVLILLSGEIFSLFLVFSTDGLPEAARSSLAGSFDQGIVDRRHDEVLNFGVRLMKLPKLLGCSIILGQFCNSRVVSGWFRLGGRGVRVVQDMGQVLRCDQNMDTSFPDDPVRAVGGKFRKRVSRSGEGGRQHDSQAHKL